MIKIPFEQIIAKIKDSTNISEEEVNEKIKQKKEQLSGLISDEGAAHIVANELSVKLFETGKLKIKDILAGMRSVETIGRAGQVYEVREFVTNGREGKVGSFMLGDDSGVIRVVLWGSQTDNLKNIQESTIVKIKDAYVKENMNARKELHLNNNSRLVINPEGEIVAEYKKPEAVRKRIHELTEKDDNVAILGTIVQVFEPRFFEVCPTCGKRARVKDDGFVCDVHASVEPKYSYVLNVFLDDGSDNMRVVCFRQQAEKLLGKTPEQMLEFKDFPEKFDAVKTELLGNMAKFVGRASKNDMFQRLEFMTNDVDTNLDPDEEIKKLDAEMKKLQEEKTQEKEETKEEGTETKAEAPAEAPTVTQEKQITQE